MNARALRFASFSVKTVSALGLATAVSHCGNDATGGGSGMNGLPANDAGSSAGGGAAVGNDAGSQPASGGTAGTSGAGGSGGSPMVGMIEPDWLTCQTDADCAIVRVRACCACAIISANVAYTADVERVSEKHEGCPSCPPSPCPPIPTPVCNDEGQCDYVVDCQEMERATLCGELARCADLRGLPCDGDGGVVRVGCFPQQELVTGDRCGEDPDTGQQLVFSGGQIPDGWTECDVAECR